MYLEQFTKPVTEGPVFINNTESNRYKAIVDMDGNEISVVSKKYKLIQNSQVVNDTLESIGKVSSDYNINEKLSWVYPGQMNLVLTFPSLLIEDDTKEGMSLSVAIKNSYNSNLAFSIKWMMYRYWCSNGAMTIYPIKGITMKHYRPIQLENIETIFEDANVKLTRISDMVKFLRTEPAKFTVMEEMTKKFPRTKTIEEAWKTGYDVSRLNAYNLYNNYTKYITHDVAPRQRDIYYSFLNNIFKKEYFSESTH